MMKFWFKLSLAILCPLLLKANLCAPPSHSLDELIEIADYVIEGTIIEQRSFWDAEGLNILTAHQIDVKQSTNLLTKSSVTLLTKGGCIDGDCVVFSNENTFQPGDYGVFFALQSNEQITSKSDNNYLSLIASQSNFIDLNNSQDVFDIHYKTYSAESIFKRVENFSGKPFAYQPKVINKSAQKKAPTISNISPLSLPADGTHTLTIRGNGFGSLTGSANIYMLNSNQPSGTSYVAIPKSFISRWSNQLIQIKVPSFDIRTNFPGVASGSVRIITSQNAEVTSTQKVRVTYNQKKLEGQSMDIISHSNNGEIPFYVSNALVRDGALPAIERAMELWYCQTGIKFTIVGYVNATCYQNDEKNVISYDDGCSITQLGFTRLSISTCTSRKDPYLKDLDIIINRKKKWSFDLEKDEPGTSDFASTILHEMGHAHLLGHVLNEDDILYPIVLRGETKKELNTANLLGGEAILSESKKQNACTRYKPVSIYADGACCTPLQNPKVNYVSNNSAVINFTKDDANTEVTVRYRKISHQNWDVIRTNRNSISLRNLDACAAYQAQVSDACSNGGNDQFNQNNVAFETKGCNTCGPPAELFAPSVTKSAITVNWDVVPNRDIYEMQYRIGYGNPWYDYKSTYNIIIFQGFDPCSVFQYRIRTYCDDEVSEYSRIKTIRTTCDIGGGRLNDQANEVEFVLAPNPVKNQTLIIPQQTDLSEAYYSIQDISGRQVQANKRLPNDNLLNLSNLTPGIYFIELVKNEIRYTQRFVKE